MANAITIGRVGLLFFGLWLLYHSDSTLLVLAGVIIAIVFAGDGVDGWVARRRNSSSKLGAVLDIAGDRVVENALWVVFAERGQVPIWAPILVLTRSFVVDVMRSVALSEGKTPFGEQSMMRSPITYWLTAGRFTRVVYGWSKAVGFVFLAWLLAWKLPDGFFLDAVYDLQVVRILGWAAVYTSLALCIIRGVPVIMDALPYLREAPATAGGSATPPRSAASTRVPRVLPSAGTSTDAEHGERA